MANGDANGAVGARVVSRSYYGPHQLVALELASGQQLRSRRAGFAHWSAGDHVIVWIEGPVKVLAAQAPAHFDMDPEQYLAIVLQNAARPRFRWDPAGGRKPSEVLAAADPTPGAPGLNRAVALPTYPKATLVAPTGLWNSNPGEVRDGSVRAAFDLLRPYLRHCHINDLWGSYPYRELFSLFRAAGYDRYTLCEVGTPVHPEDGALFYRCYRGLWRELARG